MDIKLSSLTLSILICVSLALLGNVWVDDALQTWYKELIKPKFLISLWVFYTVGIIVYLLDAIVLYRLLVFIKSFQGKSITLTAMIVVMIYNEAWNYAFFGVWSTLAGLVRNCWLLSSVNYPDGGVVSIRGHFRLVVSAILWMGNVRRGAKITCSFA